MCFYYFEIVIKIYIMYSLLMNINENKKHGHVLKLGFLTLHITTHKPNFIK